MSFVWIQMHNSYISSHSPKIIQQPIESGEIHFSSTRSRIVNVYFEFFDFLFIFSRCLAHVVVVARLFNMNHRTTFFQLSHCSSVYFRMGCVSVARTKKKIFVGRTIRTRVENIQNFTKKFLIGFLFSFCWDFLLIFKFFSSCE